MLSLMQFTSPILAAGQIPEPGPLDAYGILSIVLTAVAVGLFGLYVGTAATKMQTATLADGQQLSRRLPLSFKLLLPFTPNIRMFRKSRYKDLRVQTQSRLVSAGYDTVLSAEDYLALRLLVPFVLWPVFAGLMILSVSRFPESLRDMLMPRMGLLNLGLFLYMFMMPRMWLTRTIAARHREISRGLPFVLDLLTLSVEAGLDFMTAIRRLIEHRKIDALSEEFIRAVREMQVGRTRRDALKDMAERVNQPDLNTVVSAIVQADELGVGIGAILRIQAEQMRTRRFQRAEKLANESPVKLLFPLVCFIFPCVFLVLLGPVFLEMIKKGF